VGITSSASWTASTASVEHVSLGDARLCRGRARSAPRGRCIAALRRPARLPQSGRSPRHKEPECVRLPGRRPDRTTVQRASAAHGLITIQCFDWNSPEHLRVRLAAEGMHRAPNDCNSRIAELRAQLAKRKARRSDSG
jgi:hypothetical protein